MSSGKIMHIISGLHVGGAEMMLYRLLSELDRPAVVISLTCGGELAGRIRQCGVDVVELERRSFFSTMRQLMALIKKHKPSVIQSWLYRADLLAGFCGVFARVPVIWNVRQTQIGKVNGQRHIWLIQRVNALLSFLPARIVYCAQAARKTHEKIGYAGQKGVVICNGIETEKFIANDKFRVDQRQAWNVESDEVLIGMVGRFDPLKNHGRFFRIIESVIRNNPDTRIRPVLVGRGMNKKNKSLSALINNSVAKEKIILLDQVEDVVSVFNGLDVHVLTSDNEGWPNALGEALSIGLPCVTTQVGDVLMMMAEKEAVLEAGNEVGFADAVSTRINLSKSQRQHIAKINREFIQNHCSLENSVQQYDALYSPYINTVTKPLNRN